MGLLSITASYIFFTVVHVVCLALALAVCALYGQDLHKADQKGVYADSRWVYAVVVGAMSAVTAVVYFVPFIMRIAGFVAAIWNFILFILWIALFGIFGKLYIHAKPQGQSGIERMKNAVWVDLVSALLWLIMSFAALFYWWRHRESSSRFTGRAKV